MINTVIFDIGNVLAGFEWDGYIRSVLGDIDEQTKKEMNEVMVGDHHRRWDEFDRGVMSHDEVIASFIAVNPKYEREIRLVCDERTIKRCMVKYDYAVPWVKSVKKRGRRVLYLSNYMRTMIKSIPEVLDFMPYMDGGIFSCCVHLVKPEREIYARLCENYDLTPSRCVFIDDNLDNIQAAREFGLNAILFESFEQARAELDAILAS